MQLIISLTAILYILFLPGFFLSFVFFKYGNIDIIERLVLSFGLSIAIVPLIVFYSNLFGIPITTPTVMLEASGVIFITGIMLIIAHVKQKS